MPYQLNFAGNTIALKRRINPFPLPTNFTQDFRIDVTFVHEASADYQAIINTPEDAVNNNNFFVGCGPTGVIYFWCNTVQLSSTTAPVVGNTYTVSITVSTSKVVGISVNGSPYATATYPNLSASLYNLMVCGGTSNVGNTSYRDPFKGQIQRVETWVGGSKTGDYTNTTGTGMTMVNSIGGAVATQGGTWPVDDSEWVFYSSGTTDYSDTLSGVSFASSGNSLAATRGYGSTLNGGTHSSSGNTLAVTRGYSSVLNSATFTSSGGSLSATRGYSSLLNGGSYSYSGNILTSTFSGAAQSFNDSMLGGVYSSSGNTLASFVGMSSVMLGANYASAGGSLSSVLGYSSTLNGSIYTSAGNRLTSTWSGEVTVTIEGYTIRFADDSISATFGADNVSANFELDHVSVRWSN